MVKINIQKKDLWLVVAIVVLLVGTGIVAAYNVNWDTSPVDPAVHGHTSDEIVLSQMTQTEQTVAEAAGDLRVGEMWLCSDC